ncbi:mCG1033053 [Mus musculus]|jgi:hypothetical protein|nr:mCG1033053 [Mus musculus]
MVDAGNVKLRRNPWKARLLSLDSHQGSRRQADTGARIAAEAKLYFPLFGKGKEGLGVSLDKEISSFLI